MNTQFSFSIVKINKYIWNLQQFYHVIYNANKACPKPVPKTLMKNFYSKIQNGMKCNSFKTHWKSLERRGRGQEKFYFLKTKNFNTSCILTRSQPELWNPSSYWALLMKLLRRKQTFINYHVHHTKRFHSKYLCIFNRKSLFRNDLFLRLVFQ